MTRKLLSFASLFVLLILLLVLAPASPARSPWECRDLITPEKVGHEAFERHGLAQKLENDQFLRQESGGYIRCSLGSPRFEHDYPRLFSDIYYLFKAGSGELVVTYVDWEAPAPEPQPMPTPTPQPVDAMRGGTADRVEICIDAEAPVGIGGENSEQRSIMDILGSGDCSAAIEDGKICWDCGASGEETCIAANTALELSGEASAGPLASETCNVILGRGKLCWDCRQAPPASFPLPTPTPQVAETEPAGQVGAEPQCRDFITPDRVGQEAFERYGLAEKLEAGQFRQKVSRGSIICWSHRTIGEAEVRGDELYYRFDIETGELLKVRIRWREDLSEELPTPQITRQEAEAMVEGEVQCSYLTVIPPDELEFGIWFGDDLDRGWVQATRPIFDHPSWFVYSKQVLSAEGHEMEIVEITVIDAVTGLVLGRTCPC